jgi:hypothetical protein
MGGALASLPGALCDMCVAPDCELVQHTGRSVRKLTWCAVIVLNGLNTRLCAPWQYFR